MGCSETQLRLFTPLLVISSSFSQLQNFPVWNPFLNKFSARPNAPLPPLPPPAPERQKNHTVAFIHAGGGFEFYKPAAISNIKEGWALNFDSPDTAGPESMKLTITPLESDKDSWGPRVIKFEDSFGYAGSHIVQFDSLETATRLAAVRSVTPAVDLRPGAVYSMKLEFGGNSATHELINYVGPGPGITIMGPDIGSFSPFADFSRGSRSQQSDPNTVSFPYSKPPTMHVKPEAPDDYNYLQLLNNPVAQALVLTLLAYQNTNTIFGFPVSKSTGYTSNGAVEDRGK